MAKVLLKARPTERQLADRLAPPVPQGLELYLDSADLADDAAMRGVLDRLSRDRLPEAFTLVVEGPIRSLDGEFFHVARQSEADVEVVRRLVWMSQRLDAEAVNVHAIAPEGVESLTLETRQRTLERSLPLLSMFAETTAAAGMAPTVENMPPVLRMRQGGFYFSAIGMVPEDMLFLAEHIPSLRVCLDVSHAQLVVNAQRAAEEDAHDWPELHRFLGHMAPLPSVRHFMLQTTDLLLTAHISNASGITGEGLPYSEGDLDMDPLVRDLSARVRYLVTETLEPDPDDARFMRDAQRHIIQALGAGVGG